jgi:hypothetical protein
MHSPENFPNQMSGPLHVLRREMSASSKRRHNDLRLCRSMLLDSFDFVAITEVTRPVVSPQQMPSGDILIEGHTVTALAFLQRKPCNYLF